jgi:hypothetical protein
MLKHLNFLSNGDVVYTTGSHFIGKNAGETLEKAEKVIKDAKGKVLAIDEAYTLNEEELGRRVKKMLIKLIQTHPQKLFTLNLTKKLKNLCNVNDKNGMSRNYRAFKNEIHTKV